MAKSNANRWLVLRDLHEGGTVYKPGDYVPTKIADGWNARACIVLVQQCFVHDTQGEFEHWIRGAGRLRQRNALLEQLGHDVPDSVLDGRSQNVVPAKGNETPKGGDEGGKSPKSDEKPPEGGKKKAPAKKKAQKKATKKKATKTTKKKTTKRTTRKKAVKKAT